MVIVRKSAYKNSYRKTANDRFPEKEMLCSEILILMMAVFS
jgi:hypothetical protein